MPYVLWSRLQFGKKQFSDKRVKSSVTYCRGLEKNLPLQKKKSYMRNRLDR